MSSLSCIYYCGYEYTSIILTTISYSSASYHTTLSHIPTRILVSQVQWRATGDCRHPCPASVEESAASLSCGVLTYRKNAALCHRPRSWIVESSTPARVAVVAAPILKLWPAYWCWGKPRVSRILRNLVITAVFRMGSFPTSRKNAPGCAPRLAT